MNLSVRHPGYSAPSRASVYALAEDDFTPIEGPARLPLLWEGGAWFELDPATGRVLASGACSEVGLAMRRFGVGTTKTTGEGT